MQTQLSAVIVGLCVLVSSVESAGPELRFRPESYAAHRMHTHHLAATHHAEVLQAYAGDAASIPPQALKEHVGLIENEVKASSKSLASMPAEKLKDPKAAADVTAIKTSHSEALASTKVISEELAKESPDYGKIKEHAGRIVEWLDRGDEHVHAVHGHWNFPRLHLRTHPGER